MKKLLLTLTILLAFIIAFSGCISIEEIFKTGIGVGAFIVIVIVLIVIFLLSRIAEKIDCK